MNNDEDISLRGTVNRVTFRNPENGYTVLKITPNNSKTQTTVVGRHLNAESGEEVLILGKYLEHPKFGKQLEAKYIQQIEPDTKKGIEKLLASCDVRGMGPQTAKKIVNEYGVETIHIIKSNPEKIAKIPGVGKVKAELLVEYFSEKSARIEIDKYFYSKNFTPGLIEKIYKQYGQRAIQVVKSNPYILCSEVEGIGFLTADKFAHEFGFKKDSIERITAGILYALKESISDGNTYLPEEVLINKSKYTLGLDSAVDLSEGLNTLVRNDIIVKEDQRYYDKLLFEAEDFLANFIVKKISEEPTKILPDNQFEKTISKTEEELNLSLSEEQKKCLTLASQLKLLVITGGPGCGKTTVIRALVNFFKSLNNEIALTAPTGKAAQKMAQVCETKAQTIHRLLKFNPHLKRFEYGVNNPLKLDSEKDTLVDVVIVDETSMVDINLAKSLFSAIPRHAKLILVGDKDQLPSVGPGRIFADLVDLDCVPKIVLNKIFRRDENSLINSVAQNINDGIIPSLPTPDGETTSDVYFIEKDRTEEIASIVEKLYIDQLPRKFNFSKDDIRIITPSNKGPLGTIQLNERIQNKLTSTNQSIQFGNNKYNVGDIISQRKNNYNIHPDGVFNGDSGKIVYLDESVGTVQVELWDGRNIEYKKKDLEQISLAYATTIHRSQGSEIPCVVMIVHDKSHYILLERQLLYTGVTRAKQMLILIGTKKAIAIAINKTSQKLRFSNLIKKIELLFNKLVSTSTH